MADKFVITDGNKDLVLTVNPKEAVAKLEKLNTIADNLPPQLLERLSADELRNLATGIVDTTEKGDNGKTKRKTKQQLLALLTEATESRRKQTQIANAQHALELSAILEHTKSSPLLLGLVNECMRTQDLQEAIDKYISWLRTSGNQGSGYTDKTIAKTLSPKVTQFLTLNTQFTKEQSETLLKHWREQMTPLHKAIVSEGDQQREDINRGERVEMDASAITAWVQKTLTAVNDELQPGQWKAVTYAIALATGRRCAEVLSNQTVFAYDDERHLQFYGQLKKDTEVDEIYRIPTVVNSNLVLRGWSALVNSGKCIDHKRVNAVYTKQLTTDLPKQIKQELATMGIGSPKDARDFYACYLDMLLMQYASNWHATLANRPELDTGKQPPSNQVVIGGMLGHDNSFSATENYKKLYVTWSESFEPMQLDARDLWEPAGHPGKLTLQ